MTMSVRLEMIIERMRRIDSDVFPGPVSKNMIQLAEQQLGVVFPQSYCDFLEKVGAASLPFDVFGLVSEDSATFSRDFWDVVGMTEVERSEVEPPMLHHLIPISPNGMGDHWCLDTSRFSSEECPVVFWNHENGADQKPNQTNPSFLDWLEEMVTLEEEDQNG